jgi:yopX protein|nr:MAG TPA: YopX protein [Caudoviricetes sp.]
MKQPKVYVKSLDMVLPVVVINYHEKIVEVYFNDNADNVSYKFDEVTFIYNSGYRDKNDNYIYTGDILEYQGEANVYYIKKLLVEKDGEEESYFLTINGIYVRRLMDTDDYLVVGNIYENKDLLEV